MFFDITSKTWYHRVQPPKETDQSVRIVLSLLSTYILWDWCQWELEFHWRCIFHFVAKYSSSLRQSGMWAGSLTSCVTFTNNATGSCVGTRVLWTLRSTRTSPQGILDRTYSVLIITCRKPPSQSRNGITNVPEVLTCCMDISNCYQWLVSNYTAAKLRHHLSLPQPIT